MVTGISDKEYQRSITITGINLVRVSILARAAGISSTPPIATRTFGLKNNGNKNFNEKENRNLNLLPKPRFIQWIIVNHFINKKIIERDYSEELRKTKV